MSGVYNKGSKPLTEADLEKHIKEIMLDTEKTVDGLVFYNACKINGIVKRTPLELNLCADKKCISCQALIKAIKEKNKP